MKSIVFVLSMVFSLLGYAKSETNSNGELSFKKWCVACHGTDTSMHPGTKILSLRMGEEKAPLEWRDDLAPAYVVYIVRNGLLSMPHFRDTEISDDELRELAEYLANTNKQD